MDFCDLCGSTLLKSFKRELAARNVVSWLPSGITSLRSIPAFTLRPGSSHIVPRQWVSTTGWLGPGLPGQHKTPLTGNLYSEVAHQPDLDSQSCIAISVSFSRSSFLYPLLPQVSHVQHGLKILTGPVTSVLSFPQIFPAPNLLYFSFCLGVCFLQGPHWHLFLFLWISNTCPKIRTVFSSPFWWFFICCISIKDLTSVEILNQIFVLSRSRWLINCCRYWELC